MVGDAIAHAIILAILGSVFLAYPESVRKFIRSINRAMVSWYVAPKSLLESDVRPLYIRLFGAVWLCVSVLIIYLALTNQLPGQ